MSCPKNGMKNVIAPPIYELDGHFLNNNKQLSNCYH